MYTINFLRDNRRIKVNNIVQASMHVRGLNAFFLEMKNVSEIIIEDERKGNVYITKGEEDT